MLKVSDLGPRLLTRCRDCIFSTLPATEQKSCHSSISPLGCLPRFSILERCLVHGRSSAQLQNKSQDETAKEALHPRDPVVGAQMQPLLSKKTFMECQLCALA